MNAPSRVYDLTASLEDEMPVWPGSPPPRFLPVGSFERDGVVSEHLNCNSHTGTHLDAPRHFLAGGRSVDGIPPERLVGPALLLDLRRNLPGTLIEPDLLERHWPERLHPSIVLLETGWSHKRAPTPEYLYQFPGLSPESARWLVGKRITGIGTDTLSIDPYANKAFEAHKVLLGSDVWILEALDRLDQLREGRLYQLVAAPLRLAGGSGAMARVFALE